MERLKNVVVDDAMPKDWDLYHKADVKHLGEQEGAEEVTLQVQLAANERRIHNLKGKGNMQERSSLGEARQGKEAIDVCGIQGPGGSHPRVLEQKKKTTLQNPKSILSTSEMLTEQDIDRVLMQPDKAQREGIFLKEYPVVELEGIWRFTSINTMYCVAHKHK
eukprot:Gb_15433 [translate_table: standard]